MFLLFCSAVLQLRAQVNISAHVLEKNIKMDQTVLLEIQAETQGARNHLSTNDLIIPPFVDFQVVRNEQSHQIQIVNGKTAQILSVRIVLKPKRKGVFTLGAFRLNTDKETYQTRPISVHVEQGDNVPIEQQEDHLEPRNKKESLAAAHRLLKGGGIRAVLKLNKQSVYINEPLQAEVVLISDNLGSLKDIQNYSPPKFVGFLAERLPTEKNENSIDYERYKDKDHYRLILDRYLLFPQKPGRLNVSGGDIRTNIYRPTGQYNFFDQPVYETTLQSINIEGAEVLVKLLPKQNKPVDFSGALGDFKLKLKASKTKVLKGNPLEVTIQVVGSGNLTMLNLPPILFNEKEVEVFENPPQQEIKNTPKGQQGMLYQKYILIPQKTGVLHLPSVGFSFFNPKQNKYIEQKTDSISISIEPVSVKNSLSKEEKFKHNESNSKTGGYFSMFLDELIPYVSIIFLVFGLLFFIFIFRFFKQKKHAQSRVNLKEPMTENLVDVVNKDQASLLKLEIETAANKQDFDVFFKGIEIYLQNQIQNKYGISLSALGVENINEHLIKQGISSSSTQYIEKYVKDIERYKYAGIKPQEPLVVYAEEFFRSTF